jgi:hypothetical protein
VSDAAGDVQEQVDAVNAQGYLGFRADPYGDEQYTLTTVESAPSIPVDDRTPVVQPPAQPGEPPVPEPEPVVISSLAPPSLPVSLAAATAIDITGTGFGDQPTVYFQGASVQTVPMTSTQVRCFIAPADYGVGTYEVMVENGVTFELSNTLEFTVTAAAVGREAAPTTGQGRKQ